MDLHTSDPDAAAAFYSDVFGWHFADLGLATMITVPGYGDHLASTVDPDIHRRQQSPPPGFADSIGWPAQASGDEIPQWHVTFAVADRDATVSAARGLGASQFIPPDDW